VLDVPDDGVQFEATHVSRVNLGVQAGNTDGDLIDTGIQERVGALDVE
jgi:hypothetical protein